MCVSNTAMKRTHILIAAAIAINWAYLPANEAIANDPTCGNANVSSSMLSVTGICYKTSTWTVLCGRTQQPVSTASGRDARDNETARTLPVVTLGRIRSSKKLCCDTRSQLAVAVTLPSRPTQFIFSSSYYARQPASDEPAR